MIQLQRSACLSAIAVLTLWGETAFAQEASCQALPSNVEGAPAIRLGQVGFESGGSKRAILRTAADAPVDWRVLSATGNVVLTGVSQPFGPDENSGDTVHRIDLTELEGPGDGFVLEACGAQSRAFGISDRPYAHISEDALRYFYLNRLGTPIEADFTHGPQWARAAGMLDSHSTCFHGQDEAGNDWPGCGYRLDVTGGWADAGDYGQYVVNGGISVWTLQHFVERLDALGGPEQAGWGDGRVPVPENGNAFTDILDEARWHLEWMLAVQVPDGETVAVVRGRQDPREGLDITMIDAGGMAHHKLHERHWLPLPLLPADAQEERLLQPPSTAATLNLAAAAAQCARVWRDRDAAFADRCLTAARRAYAAAQAYPDIYAYNNFGGGGGYGDFELADEFAWAAAELFLTTGETMFLEDLEASDTLSGDPGNIAWPSVGLLPALSLAVTPGDIDPALREAARAQIVSVADGYLEDAEREGYAIPFETSQYVWGSNGNIANRGIVLALAHDITGEARYRAAVTDVMDYLLGRNALDQSYISGHGARAMRHPHHRFWAAGADPEFPEAPPGAVSGGANAFAMVDPVAREMRGTCAPQRCWADHVDAYALNEVAINWNAPVFWIAAYLDSTPPSRRASPD